MEYYLHCIALASGYQLGGILKSLILVDHPHILTEISASHVSREMEINHPHECMESNIIQDNVIQIIQNNSLIQGMRLHDTISKA